MPTQTRHLPAPSALGLDLLAALAFVALGRLSHEADGTATPWHVAFVPFVAAAALAHLAAWTLSQRAPQPHRWAADRLWPAGVIIVAITWAGGLLLRHLMGGGLAVSFALVSLAVLTGLMAAWRVVVAVRASRGRPDGAA